MAIEQMVVGDAEEVVLEAEVTNTGALALYRSLGFIRDKHLHRCVYANSGNNDKHCSWQRWWWWYGQQQALRPSCSATAVGSA